MRILYQGVRKSNQLGGNVRNNCYCVLSCDWDNKEDCKKTQCILDELSLNGVENEGLDCGEALIEVAGKEEFEQLKRTIKKILKHIEWRF